MDSASHRPLEVPVTHQDPFAHVLTRIAAAPIEREPFPHIYVDGIFPADYYRWLLARIDAVGTFVPTLYPGVGVDLASKSYRDFGLTCSNFAADPELARLHAFLKSDGFSRLLLDKFAAPDSWGARGSAIPPEKHAYFANGRTDYTCVFDLHKDLPGYEISPHPDVPTKIVTFLFYLTPNDHLSNYGTMLCTPKPGYRPERTAHPLAKLIRRLSRPLVGKHYGFGQRDEWHPWEKFDVAKMAPARPNALLVFAPNAVSYHAVRMNIPADSPLRERQTLRGFIRSGKNTGNYVSGYSHRFGRRLAFGVARLFRLGG